MKVITPEIVWHGKEPVFSADFHRNGPNWRLATGGADNDVKMWHLSEVEGKTSVVFLASLSRHTKAVNVVRFSPNGEFLATASDDSVVCVWKEGSGVARGNLVTEESASVKENWVVMKMFRGHLEDVYDLCWSPDSHFIITGSVDTTAIVWDVLKGEKLSMLSESKQYIQGVAWDPLGAFVATLSCDRNLRLYSVDHRFKCLQTINKLSIPDQGGGTRQFRMWADEGLSSFFRRLTFSPDGSLLIVPAGRFEGGDKPQNCTYIFARGNFSKPVLQLPGTDKPTVVVRCCPLLFEPWPSQGKESNSPTLFSLPYRMVYAVASLDAVFLYDTQQTAPFGYLSNIHYTSITDLAWSNDGRTLAVTSSDGYCSLVTFDPGELGTPLEQNKLPAVVARQQCAQPAAAEPGVLKSSPPPSRNGARNKDGEDMEPKITAVKPRRIRPTTIAAFGSPDRTQDDSSPSSSPSSSQSQHSSVEGTASSTKPPCVEGMASSTKPPCVEGMASSTKPPCVEGMASSTKPPCVEGMASSTKPPCVEGMASSTKPPCVEGMASSTKPLCVEGMASSTKPPCVEGTASSTKPPCVIGGAPIVEVPRKNPSGPRRVNFVTLSSPAPKPPDEPMEVQLLNN